MCLICRTYLPRPSLGRGRRCGAGWRWTCSEATQRCIKRDVLSRALEAVPLNQVRPGISTTPWFPLNSCPCERWRARDDGGQPGTRCVLTAAARPCQAAQGEASCTGLLNNHYCHHKRSDTADEWRHRGE